MVIKQPPLDGQDTTLISVESVGSEIVLTSEDCLVDAATGRIGNSYRKKIRLLPEKARELADAINEALDDTSR